MTKNFLNHLLIRGAIVLISISLLLMPMTVWAVDDSQMILEKKITFTSEEEAFIKEHPTVTMVVDSSWRPLEYVDDDGQYAGVIAEIVGKLEEYTGLNIDFKVMTSYEEGLKAVKSGKVDMLSGLANDEDMAKMYNVSLSSPYVTINSAVVSNKELNNLYESKKSKKIAVVAGDYVNDQIRERIVNSKLIECDSNEECLEKVGNDEVDMAIVASYCAEYLLSIPKYGEFHNHLMPDFNWQLSFGISNEADPTLKSIINKGLGEMTRVELNDAVYKGIMNAEYDNDLMVFVYKHPMIVVGLGLLILILIGLTVFIRYQSKKKENLRKLQDGVRLKLALEKTHLCIWELDIATRRICKIDNEQEKHGFYELRENIPESVIEHGYIHPDDVEEVRNALERVLKGDQDVESSWRVKDISDKAADSVYWWEQARFHIMFDDHNKPITAIGISEDITKEKDAQRDSLTSVYNRNSFHQKADLILKGRRHAHLQCAFLILDLDGFKQINDTYGHGVGDRVLISVGATLTKTFRAADIVGRLGGDEFVVFMSSIGKVDDVLKKADQLVENIRRIEKDEDYGFPISCSVGIAIGVKGKDDLDEMYKKADLALYDAKHAGKNQYSLYQYEEKKTILIVDDVEINRDVLGATLGDDYNIFEAENGIKALDVLKENRGIDLVLTDIVMPEMDGKELIKEIRKQEMLDYMAIIAITQFEDESQEAEILELGVDDFILKATSAGVVQKRVENILKAKEAGR